MYKVGEYVLYGQEGVCRIVEIVTRKIANQDKLYYQLMPLDNHITILVPVDYDQKNAKMRQVLSKDDIYELIKTMPDNETIWIKDKNVRKQKYNEIINKGKKFHLQDQYLLEVAEKILYDEFSVTLDIKQDEVLPFILNTIKINEK